VGDRFSHKTSLSGDFGYPIFTILVLKFDLEKLNLDQGQALILVNSVVSPVQF
jgi:hypothetical protein